MAEKMNSDVDALRDDLNALRSDLAQLAQHVRTLTSDSAAEAKANAGARLDDLGRRIEEAVADLQQQGERSSAMLRQNVQDRPLVSVLTAFGIGLLLGRLIKRID